MKFGLTIYSIYSFISSLNIICFTFNSSSITGNKSPIISSSLFGRIKLLIGCLTLILTSSRANLPNEQISLTKSILSSTVSSINSVFSTGKSAKWTDFSQVSFW